MEIVKINELFISLESEQSYYELEMNTTDIAISFSGVNEIKQHKILFLGFPVDGVNNVKLSELRKFTVKGNNALAVLYKLISKAYDFDYFFISTAGLDTMGVSFLMEWPSAFLHLNKKVFVIGIERNVNEFNVRI